VQSPHGWDKYWEILHAAADIFGPERFGAHLIAGMGESDHNMLTQVQKARPVPNQQMDDHTTRATARLPGLEIEIVHHN
jgi:biotin synthase-related radical SAM superfamily protein